MEEKILEKEYQIPFELFEKSFTQWQKKFVYPRTHIMSILFLILGVIYIVSIVKEPSNTTAYLLMGACFALAGINWYNPKKVKRTVLETVKSMEDERYRLALYDTCIEISTIIEIEPTEESEAEKEIFGDVPEETIESTKLYFNNGLKILEYDEYFIVYQIKEMYYVVPKESFSDEELEIFRKKAV